MESSRLDYSLAASLFCPFLVLDSDQRLRYLAIGGGGGQGTRARQEREAQREDVERERRECKKKRNSVSFSDGSTRSLSFRP